MSTDKLNSELSRRDFVKVAAAGAVALAAGPTVLQSVKPSLAFASIPTTPGVYTVSANLRLEAPWVPSFFMGGKPYLTDLTDPNVTPGQFPKNKQSNNATLTVGTDGKSTLVLNQGLNPCAMLFAIDDGNGASVLSTVKVDPIYSVTDTELKDKQRINGITFQLDNLGGEYLFSDCTEYAGFTGYAPLKGKHHWDVTLLVE